MYKDVVSMVKMILFSPEKLKLLNISSAWLLSLIYEGSDLISQSLVREIEYAVEGCFSLGAFHYAKDSGNFGWNSNGKVRFGFCRPEYSGSPLEVIYLFRLEYSDRNSPFHF